MKIINLYILLICSNLILAQNIILNGDFEINEATHLNCNSWFAQSEDNFDSLMLNCKANYITTNSNISHGIDLIDTSCFKSFNFNGVLLPENGEWYLSLNAWNYLGDTINGYEGISMSLNTQLMKNIDYKLNFSSYSISKQSVNFSNSVFIGVSNDAKSLGSQIYEVVPDTSVWQEFSFEFTPNNNFNYLTVWVEDNGYGQALTGIDNFILTSLTSTKDNLANNVKVYPNPFNNILVLEGEKLAYSRIFDLQGRVIFEQVIDKGKNSLDLSNLQKGVYIIDINGFKQKIIKEW